MAKHVWYKNPYVWCGVAVGVAVYVYNNQGEETMIDPRRFHGGGTVGGSPYDVHALDTAEPSAKRQQHTTFGGDEHNYLR